jgi:diaminopimelate decarboxylase
MVIGGGMVVEALDLEALWPPGLRRSAQDRLEFDDVDLEALARERGTPLWVVSRASVERNYHELLTAFRVLWPRCEVAYAMKANNLLAVVRLLHRLGAQIDASAEYEFQLALLAGVPPSQIILNGNGKSDAALHTAAQLGARQVNVDSLDEAQRLDRIAGELGTTVRCVVRVQLTYRRLLELDPSFASTLRIGEGKFGSNVATGQAAETVEAVVRAPNLQFCGYSHHVGFSGYMADYNADREVMHHAECARELCEFANDMRRTSGAVATRLDLGGGFRGGGSILIATPGSGDPVACPLPRPDEYASAIFPTVQEVLEYEEPPLLQFESGGYQIANAVLMLTSIAEVKDVRSSPPLRYVVVDGSMMMFVSRGMMRVGNPVVPVVAPLAPAQETPVDVVGQTCVYDSIVEDVRLPPVAAGDVLAVLHQGAYCETQSTQFNAFPRPEVVIVDNGRWDIVRRRETLADVHNRDLIPPSLWAGAPRPSDAA